jgi:hypothetical protein
VKKEKTPRVVKAFGVFFVLGIVIFKMLQVELMTGTETDSSKYYESNQIIPTS